MRKRPEMHGVVRRLSLVCSHWHLRRHWQDLLDDQMRIYKQEHWCAEGVRKPVRRELDCQAETKWHSCLNKQCTSCKRRGLVTLHLLFPRSTGAFSQLSRDPQRNNFSTRSILVNIDLLRSLRSPNQLNNPCSDAVLNAYFFHCDVHSPGPRARTHFCNPSATGLALACLSFLFLQSVWSFDSTLRTAVSDRSVPNDNRVIDPLPSCHPSDNVV